MSKEKTGVFTGAYAVNPANGKEVPIWIADYVLASYGTGAIMAVPAHDERDHEFAKAFGLEIIPVLAGGDVEEAAYTEDGPHINSEFLDGLDKEAAIEKMNHWLEEQGVGKKKSATVCETGCFLGSVTGVSLSRSFIGKTVLQPLFRKINCHYACQNR